MDVRASQFARAALEANLVQLRSRVVEITDDLSRVKASRRTAESSSQQFLSYATHQFKSKDEEIAELRARLHRMEAEHDATVRRMRKEGEAATAALTAESKRVEAELQETIKGLEGKLQEVSTFLDQRDEMAEQILTLQATLEEERAANSSKLTQVERDFLLDRARLNRAHAAQYADMRKRAKAEARHTVARDAHTILLQNKVLDEEVRLLAEETAHVSREHDRASAAAKTLAREVDILSEQNGEWAKRCAAQSRALKHSATKLAGLEEELKRERRDRDVERSAMERSHARETEDLRIEVDGLRSLIRLKNRELRTVKRLAAVVLQQRSEVEQFFVEALAEVKAAVLVRKRREAEAVAAAAAAAKSPLDRLGVTVSYTPSSTRGSSRLRRPGPLSAGTPAAAPGIHLRVPLSASSTRLGASRGAGGVGGESGSVSLPALAHTSRTTASEADARAAGAAAATAALSAPRDRTGASAGLAPPSVTLSDLTPEDREQVLQLLLGLINRTAVSRKEARAKRRSASRERGSSRGREGRSASPSGTGTSRGGGGGGGVGVGVAVGPSLYDSDGGGSDGESARGLAFGAPFGLAADVPAALTSGAVHYNFGFGGGGGGGGWGTVTADATPDASAVYEPEGTDAADAALVAPSSPSAFASESGRAAVVALASANSVAEVMAALESKAEVRARLLRELEEGPEAGAGQESQASPGAQ